MLEPSPAALTASRFINQTRRHVFLTGKAGTGKTTFLKYIFEHTHKKAVIVAPTGIAAINAGGSTIHSTFQLPFGMFLPVTVYFQNNSNLQLNDRNSLFRNHRLSAIKRELIRETELLIIDEVSMLRADLLDAIDAVMRHVKGKSHLSFGGAQVLFIGDLFQLPPVVKEEEKRVLNEFYKSPYFFDAQVLLNDPPVYIELKKIYRQDNPQFIDLLNNLRNNTLTEFDAAILNEHYQPDYTQNINDNYIYLTTHNHKAQTINANFLSLLKSKAFSYKAEITGEFPDNLYPIDKNMALKEGAQIMFIKNDLSGKQAYFNGKIARVKSLSENNIKVEFEDGIEQTITKYTWENKRFVLNATTNEIEEEILGEFKHYPIRLAWAITVHKSQGLTFTKAIIDVASAFAPGQVYVALSRLKDLSGLILSSPLNFRSLKGDSTISEFSESSTNQNNLETQLDQETLNYLKYSMAWYFDFAYLKQLLHRFSEELKDHKSKSLKLKFKNWLANETEQLNALHDHAQKFVAQLNSIFTKQDKDWKTHLSKRINDAQVYFLPKLKSLSSGLLSYMEHLKEEKRNKLLHQEFSKVEVQVYEQIKKINKSAALCSSILNGTSLSKKDTLKIISEDKRDHELHKNNTNTQLPAEKGKKKEKGDSQKTSFKLFREGMSIQEIADSRNMVKGTIESHLAQYVSKGELDVEELVSKERIEIIRKVIFETQSSSAKTIKDALGEDFQYGEIRLVLSTLQVKKQDSKQE